MSSQANDIGIIEPMRFSSPSAVKSTTTRLRLRHAQLDPALFLIERLVGDDREPEFLGVKIQRPILVGHRNADEFDLLDHGSRSRRPPPANVQCQRDERENSLSVYRYSG